ncbi:MAG TPA: methyltransferase [Candidatus Angelobacter sp.]|nr:methyltransferase [Candidatus Angelobacter sp.]
MDQKTKLSPRHQMMSLLATHALPVYAIAVAADLGVADLVESQPQTAAELAAKTGANADALGRVLYALNSIGVFRQDANGRHHNTELSATLRRNAPESLSGWAKYMTSDVINRTFEALSHTVMTGEPAFPKVFGKSLFEYLGAEPATMQIFANGMTSYSSTSVREAVAAYDFSKVKKIADIGGGHGAFLRGILAATGVPKGIVYDLPQVVAHAAEPDTSDLARRYSAVGGDFFKSVPEQCDLYVMRHVIHDWADENATTILSNCRKAMSPGGKVLLIELVLKDPNEPDFGIFMDLTMLTLLHGRERTIADYKRILAAANLRLTRAIPAGLHTLIEAEAA